MSETVLQEREVQIGFIAGVADLLSSSIQIELNFHDRLNYPNPTDGGVQDYRLTVNIKTAGSNVIGLGTDGAVLKARGWKFGF